MVSTISETLTLIAVGEGTSIDVVVATLFFPRLKRTLRLGQDLPMASQPKEARKSTIIPTSIGECDTVVSHGMQLGVDIQRHHDQDASEPITLSITQTTTTASTSLQIVLVSTNIAIPTTVSTITVLTTSEDILTNAQLTSENAEGANIITRSSTDSSSLIVMEPRVAKTRNATLEPTLPLSSNTPLPDAINPTDTGLAPPTPKNVNADKGPNVLSIDKVTGIVTGMVLLLALFLIAMFMIYRLHTLRRHRETIHSGCHCTAQVSFSAPSIADAGCRAAGGVRNLEEGAASAMGEDQARIIIRPEPTHRIRSYRTWSRPPGYSGQTYSFFIEESGNSSSGDPRRCSHDDVKTGCPSTGPMQATSGPSGEASQPSLHSGTPDWPLQQGNGENQSTWSGPSSPTLPPLPKGLSDFGLFLIEKAI